MLAPAPAGRSVRSTPVEIPPTFGIDPAMIQFVIAGGERALAPRYRGQRRRL
jgi:N-acetylmuramic acid 6-phosphate (MurNAc-6-P) etherase